MEYEKAIEYAQHHTPISVALLIHLSSLVMKNTGKAYKTALGDFSSAQGELRLLNVTAGVGGRSYMNYSKVPQKLAEFCEQVNVARENAATKTIDELYQLTFDAHYQLVTIHPWADGNGRMARLIMNMLQFEFGLIPAKIINRFEEVEEQNLVAATGLADRGVKTANFAVLRDTAMPAALVELGFLTTPAEEALLCDAAWQQRAAAAIVQGIVACDCNILQQS